MKVLGLVLEINPFHNGHKYFIEEARKQENYDYVIAVISTSFTMRGEVSVIDKFTKTSLLLDNNIDLVLELPIMKAVNSSDYFTYNAIEILAKIGVTDICFGSEAGDLTQLFKLNEITSSSSFNLDWKANIDKGLSYNQAATLALKENNLDEELINQYILPNNTLALGYISAIKKLNKGIQVHTIKRIDNNYYDKDTKANQFASAMSLRAKLNNNEDISSFIPSYDYNFSKENEVNEKIFNLLKYELITDGTESIKNRYMVSEGIENRMASFIDANNYEDFINNVQTKRYNASRIKRTILHIVLNNSKEIDVSTTYLRILGMNEQGKKYLSKLDKETKSLLISNIKNEKNNELLDIELKASKLYDLLTNKNTYMDEFKTPIKK